RLNVEQANRVASRVTRQPRTAGDGYRPSLVQADPPAEKQDRRVHVVLAAAPAPAAAGTSTAAAPGSERAHTAEREDALAFQEKIAPLGKLQVEAREVHLLRVVFHLREVRVVGQIQRKAFGDPELSVAAELLVPLIRKRRRGFEIGAEPANAVRLELDGGTAP